MNTRMFLKLYMVAQDSALNFRILNAQSWSAGAGDGAYMRSIRVSLCTLYAFNLRQTGLTHARTHR